MSPTEQSTLIEHARLARGFAKAKYSGFAVGAALKTTDGRIFTGCNVESSSYGLSICAERVALTKALSEGADSFTEIAIVADSAQPVSPCGACRQLLHDYAPNAVIVMANLHGDFKQSGVAELLPSAFDETYLKPQQ